MVGTEQNARPQAFWDTEKTERPQAMIPDHQGEMTTEFYASPSQDSAEPSL